ncbi:MAG TPA: hypothetical protein VMW75_08980 [Thermoanaerobaculia bacterium]|nr:hypothetical protein [Thermoanaerobaculia bacterium]
MPMRSLIGVLMLLIPAATGQAQPTAAGLPYGDLSVPNALEHILAGTATLEERRQFLAVSGRNVERLALLAAGATGYNIMLKAVEDARLDKQPGATPSSEGTTSLVSKGAVTQILGLAVEQGALTRSDDKSVATFRGDALSVSRLVVGAQQLPYCSVFASGCPVQSALQNLTFSLSFDTAGSQNSSSAGAGGSNNGVLRGTGQEFSGWTLRYDFNVRRKIPAGDFIAQVQSLPSADKYAQAAAALLAPLGSGGFADYDQWVESYAGQLASPAARTMRGLASILTNAGADLVAIARAHVPDLDKKAAGLLTEMGTYFGNRDRAFETLVNRVTCSAEYDSEQPLNEPRQSTGRLIVSARLDPAGKHQLTFNSAGTWYDQAPPGGAVRRFRDAQAALQLDVGLISDGSPVGVSMSAGFYFQWMADNALLTIPSGNLAPGTSISLPGDASVLLATKGTIAIGQIGLTLNFKNGIKAPIGISYANRTDLLTASTVRGHFGLSYDLDSLFAGFRGGTSGH